MKFIEGFLGMFSFVYESIILNCCELLNNEGLGGLFAVLIMIVVVLCFLYIIREWIGG